jgi:hypothetical protein
MEEFITVFILFVILLSIFTRFEGRYNELTYVTSNVDGRSYLVRNRIDKQEAADLLGRVNKKLIKIVEYMDNNVDTEESRRLVKNFSPDVISESLSDSSHTSYSVNKGEKIVFCLRSKDGREKLVDDNTMTFVAIHELAHLMTKSIGHNQDFWDNMKELLKVAIELGLYQKQDFKNNPVMYCGTKITDTPLKD